MKRRHGFELIKKEAPAPSSFAAEFTAPITKATAETNADGAREWLIEGYASTGDVDRHGDIILPSAFSESLPAFLTGGIILFNHDRDYPVGKPVDGRVDEKGLWLKSRIVDERIGKLIDAGVLDAFSVGVAPPSDPADIEVKDLGNGRIRIIFKKAELVETSIVTVPANAAARFTITKDFRAGVLKSWLPSNRIEEGENTMLLKVICKMLGLPDTADEATVIEALQARMGLMKAGQIVADVAKSLGLPTDATATEFTKAIAGLRNPDGFVAKADHDAVVAQLKAARVEKMLAPFAARIPEKLKGLAKQLAESGDEEGLNALVENAAPQAPTGTLTGAGASTPPEGNATMEEAAKVTPEDEHFVKTLGYFRDEVKDGRVIRKAAAVMNDMANATAVDAVEWMFGQRIAQPALDAAMTGARNTGL